MEDWSRGRKSGWKGHKKKPEEEGAAQRRKEQADGKRAARKRFTLEQGPNCGVKYLQRNSHSGGGRSRRMEGGLHWGGTMGTSAVE